MGYEAISKKLYFHCMRTHYCFIYLSFSLLVLMGCQLENSPIELEDGLVIRKSAVVNPDTLTITRFDSTSPPVIQIEGNNIEVDFGQSLLIGSIHVDRPNHFQGMALRIRGNNITIRNLNIKGYKVAIIAENSDNLRIINCDLSLNYRSKLKSTREKEHLDDWLSYHHNETDQWLRYGAGIYLRNCDGFHLEGIKVHQGQNGILMSGCNGGIAFNNDIRYNSGVGIGMYRSSNNRIMHNLLDFNVRGYSHGIYQRGQDSAGLLVYEQCQDNTFAYNSATHSGDGFFLWAGQSTMDTGKGGCNGNLIYRNDFSYAPTNGIEVTFSSNFLLENKMEECRYGIWGGYSYETLIIGNHITDSDFGIAIEHGHHNTLIDNMISGCDLGLKLWQRDEQPADWGFAEVNDVRSRDYQLGQNQFENCEKIFEFNDTRNIQFLTTSQADSTRRRQSETMPSLPQPLSRGMDTDQSDHTFRGRKFIIVNEWGPYDQSYPLIWLRETNEDKYVFALFGPEGNWRITGAHGFTNGSLKSGTFPNTLTSTLDSQVSSAYIELEFIGAEFTDQFGRVNKRGVPYTFRYDIGG